MSASRRLGLHVARLACAGILIALSGCATSLPDNEVPESGTYYQITPLRYHLSARTYLVHVPRNYHPERTWPLVLVLHGAFNTANGIEKHSNFSRLADREGFIVAYPNGIGFFGFLQHWNAGHCCGLAQMDHVDDVAFLNCVIRDVSSRLRVDPKRIYVVGHSNGGMLAYHFASANSRRIAGVGVVAGTIGSSANRRKSLRRVEPPETPVPLIAIHGRKDASVPFAGGRGQYLVGDRRFESVNNSVECWAGYCGCERTPEVHAFPQGGGSTTVWHDAEGKPWVVLHTLEQWGHSWPTAASVGQPSKDRPRRTFEASEVIWEFFDGRTQSGN